MSMCDHKCFVCVSLRCPRDHKPCPGISEPQQSPRVTLKPCTNCYSMVGAFCDLDMKGQLACPYLVVVPFCFSKAVCVLVLICFKLVLFVSGRSRCCLHRLFICAMLLVNRQLVNLREFSLECHLEIPRCPLVGCLAPPISTN